ncbi:MAG: hypothetical protein LBC78_05775 [Oscillospiraceae bacterium]|nr:hypothetical protein [Oscillospiraceae bacterium]
MSICQKRDCKYFSTSTLTCDYTLINSKKRPCPIDDCSEYAQRRKIHSWMKFWPSVLPNPAHTGKKEADK